MFADVSSSSRATCPNTEMRRRDRRCDSEVRSVRQNTRKSFRATALPGGREHECSAWGGNAGEGVPTFFDASPLPHFFGLKFVQKLVHCCN